MTYEPFGRPYRVLSLAYADIASSRLTRERTYSIRATHATDIAIVPRWAKITHPLIPA